MGGLKPGIIVQRLAVATKRKRVPRNARYFSGWPNPTSWICFSIPVTIISNEPCQREMAPSVASLRVISFEPNDIRIIMIHVVTMVSKLGLIKPYCPVNLLVGE